MMLRPFSAVVLRVSAHLKRPLSGQALFQLQEARSKSVGSALSVRRGLTPTLSSLVRGTSSVSDEITEPPLPSYVPRVGEPVEVKRARLLYQSRKRGMLENGLLLSTFASAHLKNLTSSQLDLYDDIINRPSNDWKLYYWMTGREETPAEYNNEVMDMLKVHARNDEREARYRQPDL